MRVLLTGATGLIGSAVYKSLITNHDVIRLGRSAGNYDFYFDILRPCNKAFPACDAVVHCAGVVDEDFRDSAMERFASLTNGADILAKATTNAGAKRAVYISSSHVYGRQEGTIAETSNVNPLSYYAIAHYCAEQLFKKNFSGKELSALILRPNAVYGPLADLSGFKRWALIPFSFPLEAWASNKITLKSLGTQQRNFVCSTTIGLVIANWLSSPTTRSNEICHPLGRNTESVFSFAQRCNRVAAQITGLDYQVDRPAEGPQSATPFEYASTTPTMEDKDALDNHIKGLIGWFYANPAWARKQAHALLA